MYVAVGAGRDDVAAYRPADIPELSGMSWVMILMRYCAPCMKLRLGGYRLVFQRTACPYYAPLPRYLALTKNKRDLSVSIAWGFLADKGLTPFFSTLYGIRKLG